MEDNFENYNMSYVADIEYNSMILIPVITYKKKIGLIQIE